MTTSLFICPWPPDPHGGGGARRAWQTFRALTELGHAVHLLITLPAGTSVRVPREPLALAASLSLVSGHGPAWRQLAVRARQVALRRLPWGGSLLPSLDMPSPGALAVAHELVPVAPGRLDRIHVMRLQAAPFMVPFATSSPLARRTLDLDDIESHLHRRAAELARDRGDLGDARVSADRALRAERAERRWLPRFDRVYACSSLDAGRLATRFPGLDLARLPNTCDAPRAEPPARTRAQPPRLLFVGSLGHAPNDDAVRFFATEVLPLLPASYRLHLVGHGLLPRTRELLPRGRVEVHGHVADLAPHYAAADAVVAPIRAGGGTRIKIIEAFAHRRPVVSTTLGAEGLAVAAGRELLIADSGPAFAAACVRAVEDEPLATELVSSAQALYLDRYTPALLPALIA